MKLYCVENETCGYATYIDDFEPIELTNERLICPECFSTLLIYDNDTKPSWITESIASLNQGDGEP